MGRDSEPSPRPVVQGGMSRKGGRRARQGARCPHQERERGVPDIALELEQKDLPESLARPFLSGYPWARRAGQRAPLGLGNPDKNFGANQAGQGSGTGDTPSFRKGPDARQGRAGYPPTSAASLSTLR